MTALPLVLVPGLLGSARLYAPQVTSLWPQRPVMVADHRQDLEIGAVAQRILDNAPPRFALAGLSYGGYIALAIMRIAPERIERLALLDTSARADTAEQKDAREKFIAMAQAGKLAEVVETLAPRFVHHDRRRDEALMATVRKMAVETGPEAFVRQERAIMSRGDLRPLLGSIRCPTLVVVGDRDELTTPDLAKEIAGGIAGSHLVVIPQCGHLSTIEQPEAVNAALTEWLRG